MLFKKKGGGEKYDEGKLITGSTSFLEKKDEVHIKDGYKNVCLSSLRDA